MRLEIPYDESYYRPLYDTYCKQLYKVIQDEIRYSLNYNKYLIREPYILKMNFIKWKNKPLDKIDLRFYITHCLVLNKTKDGYVIELNDTALVTGSLTKVKDLIRLIEYGNEILPAYPLIRNVLAYYQVHWQDEFQNVLEKYFNR